MNEIIQWCRNAQKASNEEVEEKLEDLKVFLQPIREKIRKKSAADKTKKKNWDDGDAAEEDEDEEEKEEE